MKKMVNNFQTTELMNKPKSYPLVVFNNKHIKESQIVFWKLAKQSVETSSLITMISQS